MLFEWSLISYLTSIGRFDQRSICAFLNLEGYRAAAGQEWIPGPIIWFVACFDLYLCPRLTLSVDLYGRGYSDAPKTCYDAGLYTTQLALLMQHIKWDKAHIAGLSMVTLTSINITWL